MHLSQRCHYTGTSLHQSPVSAERLPFKSLRSLSLSLSFHICTLIFLSDSKERPELMIHTEKILARFHVFNPEVTLVNVRLHKHDISEDRN